MCLKCLNALANWDCLITSKTDLLTLANLLTVKLGGQWNKPPPEVVALLPWGFSRSSQLGISGMDPKWDLLLLQRGLD